MKKHDILLDKTYNELHNNFYKYININKLAKELNMNYRTCKNQVNTLHRINLFYLPICEWHDELSQSNLIGTTLKSSTRSLSKEGIDIGSNPDEYFKPSTILNFTSGREPLIHYIKKRHVNKAICGYVSFTCDTTHDWSLVSCPECLKLRGKK